MSLATDFKAMIDAALHKEQVTYDPHGQTPRQIWVLVNRDPTLGETIGGVTARKLTRIVHIVNDETEGVATPQINRDTIHMKAHLYDTEDTVFKVDSVLYQDPGKYQLRVVY